MVSDLDKRFLLALRLLLAWVFLYAASHQVFDPTFSINGFLSHTKTFHDFFAPLTAPSIAPVMSFLVAYGHLAIGLSLLFGCLVRLSAPCSAVILVVYWMAHMDFPYVEDNTNFLIDYHIVYAVVALYLMAKGAGRYYGLDGVLGRSFVVAQYPALRKVLAA